MSLSGVETLFFLVPLLAIYWATPRWAPAQNLILLLASYVFYASWDRWLALLLLGTTVVDFVAPLLLATGARKKVALGLSLLVNLGLLTWFKYGGLLLGHSLALPLGLSFYSLQRLGYALDVYYGRQAPSRSLLEFATFVAFFPQITAGPISRAGELLPQLQKARRLDADMMARAGSAILLGYFLKACVADNAATLIAPVFQAPASYGPASLWFALLAYALQLFSDFAGYTLLVIGIGRLFGIELPQNFNQPFRSTSLPEIWRRWHMSFNRWLFDYLFTPLMTGTGLLRGRTALCLMLVFLASGAWHGSHWTFVIWGALHGLGMAVHHVYDQRYRAACRRDRRYVGWRKATTYVALSWLLTQTFFVMTLVPFRCASLGVTADYARQLLGAFGSDQSVFAEFGFRDRITLLLLVVPIGMQCLGTLPAEWLGARIQLVPAPVRGVFYGLVIVFLVLFVPVGASTFIYRNF